MATNIPRYKQIKSKQQNAEEAANREEGNTRPNSAESYINSFASKNKDRRVGFRIQTSSYNQFAKICEQEGVSVSSKLNQMINFEIAKHQK